MECRPVFHTFFYKWVIPTGYFADYSLVRSIIKDVFLCSLNSEIRLAEKSARDRTYVDYFIDMAGYIDGGDFILVTHAIRDRTCFFFLIRPLFYLKCCFFLTILVLVFLFCLINSVLIKYS